MGGTVDGVARGVIVRGDMSTTVVGVTGTAGGADMIHHILIGVCVCVCSYVCVFVCVCVCVRTYVCVCVHV